VRETEPFERCSATAPGSCYWLLQDSRRPCLQSIFAIVRGRDNSEAVPEHPT